MMVVVREDNLAPSEWRLGHIHAMILGPDGLARVADVQTVRGIIRRPLVKLVVLSTFPTTCRVVSYCRVVLLVLLIECKLVSLMYPQRWLFTYLFGHYNLLQVLHIWHKHPKSGKA